MSNASSITSIPTRSQASSIAVLIGLWALRIALNPAALSSRTRRSSARAMVAAPSTPLSGWMQAPRSFTVSPLMRRPCSGSSRSERIPKVTSPWLSLSRLRPSSPVKVTCAEYRAGESAPPALGRGPTGVAARLRSQGITETGVSSTATTFPSALRLSVTTRASCTRSSRCPPWSHLDNRPFVVDVGRGHPWAVDGEMYVAADVECGVSVDAPAGVPARVILGAGLDPD